MKKYWLIIGCVAACVNGVFASGETEKDVGELPPSYLGEMDSSFWRTTPVPDRGQLIGSAVVFPGSPLDMDFLQETDFPYNFKKYGDSPDTPYLFHTDEIVMVRFLGGWDMPQEQAAPNDLAFRDADGAIQIRRDLLRKHFEKFEESGAVDNYVIVLDNVPYCFPKNPARGPFGQVQPPADLAEWQSFIVAVCKEITDILGEERANKLRFRLGTEMQGSNKGSGHNRFDGTQEEFFSFYKTTALAVKSVLPGAKFGPWNIAAVDQGLDVHLVDYRKLAGFCISNNLPLDFIGSSLYFVPLFGKQSPLQGVDVGDWNRLTNIDPEEKIMYYKKFWSDLQAIDPQLKDVPLEIHEFGVLDNELALKSAIMEDQLSSRDAALLFQTMFMLKKEGVSKCFHWGLTSRIPGPNRRILNSHGWLLQVLDHTTGGKIWELPVRNRSRRSISQSMALGFFDCENGKNYVVVSTFNPYRYIHTQEQLEVLIPERLMKLEGRKIRIAKFDVNNSPQRLMRDDLAAAGLLTEDYRLHPDFSVIYSKGLIPAAVTDMKAATKLIQQNETKYVAACSSSLRLEPLAGQLRSEDGHAVIPVTTRASSVLVFVFE